MSKAKAVNELPQPRGELSAEALAILAELSENEIASGMIETADLTQLPERLTEEWTIEQVKEVFAGVGHESSASELPGRA